MAVSLEMISKLHESFPRPAIHNAGPATTPSSDLTTPFVDISHQTLLKVPPKEAVTAEDNVKLLVAAIGSLTGKIDWNKVAKECNIVSPAAASKRYERLLKANGITKSTTTNDGADSTLRDNNPDDDRSAGSAEGEAPKKRKAPAGKGRGKGAASNKVKLEDEADEDEAEI